MSSDAKWDVFTSHSSDDKQKIAKPLAEELISLGLKVWYDEITLKVGDSLSREINNGLSHSEYGVVILSKTYLQRGWTIEELEALITLQASKRKTIILPIWHDVSPEEIQSRYPMVANSLGMKTSEGIKNIAIKLYRQIRDIKILYNFNSDMELSKTLSSLYKSIKDKELLIKETEEEMIFAILTKIYLLSKGYHNIYIYFWPLSEALSSNEIKLETLKKYIEILITKNLIESKSLGTISITHNGIKKIENSIENSKNDSTFSKINQIVHSLTKKDIDGIHEIQKLRYIILRTA